MCASRTLQPVRGPGLDNQCSANDLGLWGRIHLIAIGRAGARPFGVSCVLGVCVEKGCVPRGSENEGNRVRVWRKHYTREHDGGCLGLSAWGSRKKSDLIESMRLEGGSKQPSHQHSQAVAHQHHPAEACEPTQPVGRSTGYDPQNGAGVPAPHTPRPARHLHQVACRSANYYSRCALQIKL